MSKNASESEQPENPVADAYDTYMLYLRKAERMRRWQHVLVWLALCAPILLTFGVRTDHMLLLWAAIGLLALAFHVVRVKALEWEDHYFKKWRKLQDD